MFAIKKLTIELMDGPLGLDAERPRFSYILESDRKGIMQDYRRIAVVEGSAWDKEKTPVWDTGKVKSDQSVHISYQGAPLQPKSTYTVKAQVWNNRGESAQLVTSWETGLMGGDWSGRWITNDYEETETYNPAPCLRRDVTLKGKVDKARLFVTARGLYEFHINGHRVGKDIFTPGCTAYEDGTGETIVSDDRFKASPSYILKSDFYQGEAQDTTEYDPGWSCPGFDDSRWPGTRVEDLENKEVVGTLAPLVGRVETLKPVEKFINPKGEVVLDMGQNMVGWVRFTIKGKQGQRVILHHAPFGIHRVPGLFPGAAHKIGPSAGIRGSR